MMKMKKLLCIALAAVMVLALAACGSTTQPSGGDPTSNPSSEPAANPSSGAEAAQYVVGICQQMTHDALDQATLGFKDAAQ